MKINRRLHHFFFRKNYSLLFEIAGIHGITKKAIYNKIYWREVKSRMARVLLPAILLINFFYGFRSSSCLRPFGIKISLIGYNYWYYRILRIQKITEIFSFLFACSSSSYLVILNKIKAGE